MKQASCKMKISKHAKIRFKQRGIPSSALDFVLMFCTPSTNKGRNSWKEGWTFCPSELYNDNWTKCVDLNGCYKNPIATAIYQKCLWSRSSRDRCASWKSVMKFHYVCVLNFYGAAFFVLHAAVCQMFGMFRMGFEGGCERMESVAALSFPLLSIKAGEKK